jgi:DNA polymerase I-like protein with 3'-5' exonuclease and polymerase domains
MSGCPPSFGGHFSGKGESLVKGVVRHLAELELAEGVHTHMQSFLSECQYMYSTMCHSEKLKKEEIIFCRDTQVLSKIIASNAKVILCLGKSLATFFGLAKITQKDLRGVQLAYRLPNGKTVKLIFSIGVKEFLANPGLYSVLAGDIKRAAKILASISTPKRDILSLKGAYDIATDLSDIKDICTEYQTYTKGKPLSQTLMGLDTETNTLFPWWEGSRIISLSAGFGNFKACSFLVDHKSAEFNLEDVLPHMLKITCSDHAKAWWNYKFDLQMFMSLFKKVNFTRGLILDIERETKKPFNLIAKNYGILNTRWDGLLGEHLLDENKQGWYSLKDVIADYKYELFGYEATLENCKTEVKEEKKEEVKQSLDAKTLGELILDTGPFATDTCISGLKENYESLKQSITRKIKRAKNTQNDILLSISKEKLEKIQEEYKDVKKQARIATEKLAEEHYVEKPKRAGLPQLYTYEDLPVDTLLLYGAVDADGTVDICLEQRKALFLEKKEGTNPYSKDTLSLMDRHCLPLTTVLSTIQSEGVFTCPATMEKMHENLTIDIVKAKTEVLDTLEDDFPFIDRNTINLQSSKCLGNILLGYYGLPILEETDLGAASFSEEVLQRYADEYKNAVAIKITEYKKLSKARDTFVGGFKELSGYDQRIHGSIHLNGACTGRTSSSGPNLQNIPLKILNYVIKSILRTTPIEDTTWEVGGLPRSYYMDKYNWNEGERLVMVDADLSGAEVKVMARFAPDEALIEALNSGLDAHSWITSEIHGVPYDDIQSKRKLTTDEGKHLDNLRQGTKAVVFKILYGGEPDDQELKHLIFERFPGIPEYLARIKQEVYSKGKVYTPNGRCRRFPMVKISNWAARRMYRQAINFGIQSYCSDIVLNMLNNIFNTLYEVRGRLLLTVHDSVVFECPESEIDNLQDYLHRNITQHIATEFPDIPVSMPFGFKVGRNYGDMFTVESWHKEEL